MGAASHRVGLPDKHRAPVPLHPRCAGDPLDCVACRSTPNRRPTQAESFSLVDLQFNSPGLPVLYLQPCACGCSSPNEVKATLVYRFGSFTPPSTSLMLGATRGRQSASPPSPSERALSTVLLWDSGNASDCGSGTHSRKSRGSWVPRPTRAGREEGPVWSLRWVRMALEALWTGARHLRSQGHKDPRAERHWDSEVFQSEASDTSSLLVLRYQGGHSGWPSASLVPLPGTPLLALG